MSNVKSAYITSQPRVGNLRNTFDLMGNERFLNSWTYEDKSCGYIDAFYINLTDARLLLRSENTACCGCCCDPNHQDASIFLRDIAEMRESTESNECCARCCLRCCPCCACCCNVPKYLEIRGSFGSKMLHVGKDDLPKVQVEIPAAIGNHKLVSQY